MCTIKEEMVVCRDCGEVVLRNEASEYGDDTYICPSCLEDNYEICRECGTLEYRVKLNHDRYNNDFVCDDCYDKKDMVRCDDCGALVSHDDWYSDGSMTICSSCYEENYYTCIDCGAIVETDESYYIESSDKIVCRHCVDENYYLCDECGNYFPIDEVHYDDDICVCDDCYNGEYFTCSYCDEIVHCDNIYYDNDGDPCCQYCYNERGGSLNSYSYKPNPIFHDVKDYQIVKDEEEEENTLYMGIELEVDKGDNLNDSVKMVQDKLDWCYCKSDGSLNNGFEIVSHPLTLDFITCRKNSFKEIFENLLNNGWRSHDTSTCGLHCHVNRTFFGETHIEQDLNIAKVILIVNLLWTDMINFSRRKVDEVERWCKRNNYISKDTTPNKTEEEVICDCKKQPNRYYAVNLENRNTIEFRLFKGTLKLNTFIATMQFVSNICNMAKEIKLSDIYNVTMEDIINYNNYEELKTYAKERGII